MNQNLYAPPESPLADQPFDQQPKRPVSVTIIAWILIAFCVLNLLFMAIGRWTPVARQLFAHSGLSDTAHLMSGVIGMLAEIVFAAYMLRGANWARWLYLAYSSFGVATLVFLANSSLLVLPSAIKTLVAGYFLLRRDANLFFSARFPATSGSGVGSTP